MAEMKNSLGGLNSRLKMSEQRIIEIEDRQIKKYLIWRPQRKKMEEKLTQSWESIEHIA